MWSGSAMPGHSTVCSGKIGISMDGRSLGRTGAEGRRGYVAGTRGIEKPPVARRLRRENASRQWAQDRALPASSAVRKLEPQPQPDTAFGLLTVNPAPISV